MTRLHQRIVLTAACAVAAALISWNLPPYAPGATTDFAWVWSGARAWLAGLDPYASVGPGRLYEFWSALWYPLPALLVGVPFALVSLPMANALFMAMSTALLVWGLTRHPSDRPKLILLVSFAWLSAMQNAQWSPLMTAAALTPSFDFLLACKPTLGPRYCAPTRLAVRSAACFWSAW